MLFILLMRVKLQKFNYSDRTFKAAREFLLSLREDEQKNGALKEEQSAEEILADLAKCFDSLSKNFSSEFLLWHLLGMPENKGKVVYQTRILNFTKKINMIKIIRTYTMAGLKESKDFIEGNLVSLPIYYENYQTMIREMEETENVPRGSFEECIVFKNDIKFV